MSGTKTLGRERRCRVMLVGPASEVGELSEQLGDDATRVQNPFEAIGEIAAAPPEERASIVVLAESMLRGVSDDPAAALRRLDSSLRIFLVKDAPDAESSAAAGALADDEEFDAVLYDWPSAEQMKRLMAKPGEDVESAERRNVEVSRERMDVESSTENGGMSERPVVETFGRNDAAPQGEGEEPLGDVDLVEAITGGAGRSSVRELALKLVRQHTGWTDVSITELDAADPEGGARAGASDGRAPSHASTARAAIGSHHPAIGPLEPLLEAIPGLLRVGNRVLGVLRAPGASQPELQRWADWLARWLVLDEDYRLYRDWSLRDELTGAWNRRYFTLFLSDAIRTAASRRLPVTLMVFDLDDFKRYNDEYGHAAGDEILRETVRLLNSVIRKSDRVCRIGGDEFAVIFTDPGGPRAKGSAPPETVETLAQRFQDQVCRMNFPKLGIEAPGTLSISAGLATFPWDGWDPEDLLRRADQLAIQSKRKGKNAVTLGPGARQLCDRGE